MDKREKIRESLDEELARMEKLLYEEPARKLARERKMTVALARKNGLKGTAKVIARARCFNECPNIPYGVYLSFSEEYFEDAVRKQASYQEIFDAADKEGGVDKLLKIIVEIGNRERIFQFASCVKGFKKSQMDYLISIVSQTKSVHWAHCFFRHVKRLTKDQVDNLIRVLKEDPSAQYAYYFLRRKDGRRLKKDQIKDLVSIIFNDINNTSKDCLSVAHSLLIELLSDKHACKRLTEKQRARLRAIEERFSRRMDWEL